MNNTFGLSMMRWWTQGFCVKSLKWNRLYIWSAFLLLQGWEVMNKNIPYNTTLLKHSWAKHRTPGIVSTGTAGMTNNLPHILNAHLLWPKRPGSRNQSVTSYVFDCPFLPTISRFILSCILNNKTWFYWLKPVCDMPSNTHLT